MAVTSNCVNEKEFFFQLEPREKTRTYPIPYLLQYQTEVSVKSRRMAVTSNCVNEKEFFFNWNPEKRHEPIQLLVPSPPPYGQAVVIFSK